MEMHGSRFCTETTSLDRPHHAIWCEHGIHPMSGAQSEVVNGATTTRVCRHGFYRSNEHLPGPPRFGLA